MFIEYEEGVKRIERWEEAAIVIRGELKAGAKLFIILFGPERAAWFFYKCSTFWIALIVDVGVVNFSLRNWLILRVFLNTILFLAAYFCGWLSDKMRPNVLPDSRYTISMAWTDALALWLYQIPVYVILALYLGGSWDLIGYASLVYFITTCATGWVYGQTLNWTRRLLLS